MTFTRSVLFASLLAAAAFGCRNRSTDNTKDHAAKPVETTDQNLQRTGSAEYDTGSSAVSGSAATTPTGSARIHSMGTRDQDPTDPTDPSGMSGGGTVGSADTLSGSASGMTGDAGVTNPSGATPESGTTGSANTTGSTTGSDQGTTPMSGSSGIEGSGIEGSATPPSTGSDQGTLEQRGGALNGNFEGDRSNQP